MELRDLKVGNFVRTRYGIIDKITISYDGKCNNPNCNCKHISCEHNYYNEEDIIKASYKLIDLVEENDYINGMKVKDNDGEYIVLDKIINNGSSLSYLEICESDIKTIITHEQIEQMSYKVGE